LGMTRLVLQRHFDLANRSGHCKIEVLERIDRRLRIVRQMRHDVVPNRRRG
jgi:hypothetical protein